MNKFSSPFMAKSPLNEYKKVNVQDLQDMGEVKKNKKGKYVVNENPTTSKDTLYIPKNTKSFTGKDIKVGSLIDESDYEDIANQFNSPFRKQDSSKCSSLKSQLEAQQDKLAKIKAECKGNISCQGEKGIDTVQETISILNEQLVSNKCK
jgi:hypothetical protein